MHQISVPTHIWTARAPKTCPNTSPGCYWAPANGPPSFRIAVPRDIWCNAGEASAQALAPHLRGREHVRDVLAAQERVEAGDLGVEPATGVAVTRPRGGRAARVRARPAPSSRRSARPPTPSCRRCRPSRTGTACAPDRGRTPARASPSSWGRASGGGPPTAPSTAERRGRRCRRSTPTRSTRRRARPAWRRRRRARCGPRPSSTRATRRGRPRSPGPNVHSSRSTSAGVGRRRVERRQRLAEPARHRGPRGPRDPPVPGVVAPHDQSPSAVRIVSRRVMVATSADHFVPGAAVNVPPRCGSASRSCRADTSWSARYSTTWRDAVASQSAPCGRLEVGRLLGEAPALDRRRRDARDRPRPPAAGPA